MMLLLRVVTVLSLLCAGISGLAQVREPGMLSLGGRNTLSLFSEGHSGEAGIGMGGQFRVRLTERINTEWYADFVNTIMEDQVGRKDYHIGWSVLYYPFSDLSNSGFFWQPFVEAGHCFDYTRVKVLLNQRGLDRGSSAVQMGIGTHLNLTQHLDLSLKTQYMIHLGTDIHSHVEGGNIILEKHGAGLEGHLLVTMSMNYKLVNLW